MAYNIDETIDPGDPHHVEHHEALADAVNDLDQRVDATIRQVTWNGTSWPPRPSGSIVWWIGGPSSPPTGALINDVHFPNLT